MSDEIEDSEEDVSPISPHQMISSHAASLTHGLDSIAQEKILCEITIHFKNGTKNVHRLVMNNQNYDVVEKLLSDAIEKEEKCFAVKLRDLSLFICLTDYNTLQMVKLKHKQSIDDD